MLWLIILHDRPNSQLTARKDIERAMKKAAAEAAAWLLDRVALYPM